MQKILAGHAAPLLAAIQSQLSEESQVIQSEELPPQGKVDKNVTFLCCRCFRGKEKRLLPVFAVLRRPFVNNPSGFDTTTVPLRTAGNLER